MCRYSLKHSLVLFLSLVLLGTTAFAQETGSISGTVTDKEDGTTLPGVNVVIKGSTSGAATDPNGKYTISGLRPGTYTLQVSYIGYERTLLTGIRVEANETTQLDIAIKQEVLSAEGEVTVIGEAPIFDVEKSQSSTTVSKQDIEATPIQKIEDLVGLQAGVTKDPTGLYIKGGRANETGYVVDGVSAQDPLAGTGFGLDIGTNSLKSVEVITGGLGAQYGDVTSGVVNVTTPEGGDTYEGTFTHQRDNFGRNVNNNSNFFSDTYEFSLGGPSPFLEKLLPAIGLDLPGKFSLYTSAQVELTNGFTKVAANNVQTSLTDNDFFSPRQNNRWNGIAKLTWDIKPGMELEASYQRSLTVNQNTRMLQITGADVQIRPGFQFFFINQMDNANTFAHDNNLSYIKWTHSVNETMFYDIQVSRLFTQLRADANGRPWRPDSVDGEFDAESIITPPVNIFEGTEGFRFALPGPGLANNGGLASLFHDHFAEEIVAKSTITKFFNNQQFQINGGVEFKFQDYQWIDIIRPWVGAPIQIDENTVSESNRLGASSDIWRAKPKRGAFFLSNQIRYKGLIANVGARLEYWAPGQFVDSAVQNPAAPVPDAVRENYMRDTFGFLGLRFKTRLLPKVRVSFPVRDNMVMFFNYGHSTKLPHPRFVYAGLDPFFQDRSFLSNLGNPNLDMSTDISYEIGMRNQLGENDALNVSVFWRDKFDFVTTQRLIIEDATGRETERAFRVNGDFARVRGIDVSYIKRFKDILSGTISISRSLAEGLSSTNDDALRDILVGGQNIGTNVETPLAWDRPWDIKGNVTFTWNKPKPLFGFKPLNNFTVFTSAVYRSGLRYTPQEFQGFETNPITGERNWRPIYEQVANPELRFSETGPSWFFMDLNIRKWIDFGSDQRLLFSLEVSNILNNKNSIIVNPVTGKAFKTDFPESEEALIALRDNREYDVPNNVRDPRFLDPRDNNTPSFANPANFLAQRHIVFGLTYEF